MCHSVTDLGRMFWCRRKGEGWREAFFKLHCFLFIHSERSVMAQFRSHLDPALGALCVGGMGGFFSYTVYKPAFEEKFEYVLR